MSDDWLEIAPGRPARKKRRKRRKRVSKASAPRVVAATKLPNEVNRAPTMQVGAMPVTRTWACDGEYVYFRRKRANPHALERHERFIASGDYVHVETQDDVEVYRLTDSSPFRRKAYNLAEAKFYDVRREVIRAAVRRDWVLFADGLEELAGRLKGSYHAAIASEAYKELLSYVFTQITMRGGPAQGEIDRELGALRSRRGERRSSVIAVPMGIRA